MNKWWYKVGFYLLSMVFFLVIVMILGTSIPVYFGSDWVFMGWDIVFSKGVVTDTKFENVSSNVMSFVASYFFPLVSFNLGTTWRHIVVLALLFVIIGIIYVKADIYYCNPTLLLLGFRTYKVHGKFCENIEFKKTIIVWGHMKDGDKFKYIPIDDNTSFAYKI